MVPGSDSPRSAPSKYSHPSSAPPASADDSLSVNAAATLSDVGAALAALYERESEVTAQLDVLMETQSDLSRDLRTLDLLRARLRSQVITTRAIGNGMFSSAADTANRLSHRIKLLDLEKRRVDDTLKDVEQVAELKACVHGVAGSMGASQDWEAAAVYISRASKVSEDITKSDFASYIVPSAEVPDPPWVTLETAKDSLCHLFLREFEKAAKEEDSVKVTRYFKLFPLIGRGDTGLDAYGNYVCRGIAGAARTRLRNAPRAAASNEAEGFFYPNALAKLFEHIIKIIEGHTKLVEQHYGVGTMVKIIERLQIEADVQGGIILDSWSDERAVERRLTDIKSYSSSTLVQSLIQPQKRATPTIGRGTHDVRYGEDEGVNLKEVDCLLNEISAMLGRWSIYVRFIARKCSDALQFESEAGLPKSLTNLTLGRKISANLITPYKILTTFFSYRSVEKAFQINDYPSGLSLSLNRSINAAPPFVILAVDNIILIVNVIMLKSLATSQKETVAHAITTIGRVLDSSFIGTIWRKMRDETYPKPLVQGSFSHENKIISLIVLINSLDAANKYLARIVSTNLGVNQDLKNSLTGSSPIHDAFPGIKDASYIAELLSNFLRLFTITATELMNEGIQTLFDNAIQPRLRQVISDTFRHVDYSLTQEELPNLAADDDGSRDSSDHVTRTFEHRWDQLMRPIERIMTAKPFAILLDITAQYLAHKALERRLWSYSGRTSAFGAVRMEKDFSNIANVVARGNYSVKGIFRKIMQILRVVNMEDEEWVEVSSEEGGEDSLFGLLTKEEKANGRTFVKG